MNWSARPLRRARLFKSLLSVGAALALAYSCWPLLYGQPLGHALLVVILALIALREHGNYKQSASSINNGDDRLSRIAPGHWQVSMGGQVADGSLQHVWNGWGWITLRVQLFGRPDSVSVTVWRARVSDTQWHQLRVWTHWELAMLTPEVRT